MVITQDNNLRKDLVQTQNLYKYQRQSGQRVRLFNVLNGRFIVLDSLSIDPPHSLHEFIGSFPNDAVQIDVEDQQADSQNELGGSEEKRYLVLGGQIRQGDCEDEEAIIQGIHDEDSYQSQEGHVIIISDTAIQILTMMIQKIDTPRTLPTVITGLQYQLIAHHTKHQILSLKLLLFLGLYQQGVSCVRLVYLDQLDKQEDDEDVVPDLQAQDDERGGLLLCGYEGVDECVLMYEDGGEEKGVG